MELRIEASELSKALQRVQGVVEKKTTMPILANVLLKASGKDQLTVAATNLEIGLTGTVQAQVKQEGAITLAGKAIYDIVRSLPQKEVTLKRTANNWVEITCGKISYKVVGMSAEQFPTMPTFESVDFFDIEPAALKEMVDKTLYSVSTDETRYNLTGVYCEPMQNGPGLRMVSTDGHRLSIVEKPMNKMPPMKKGVIVPRKGFMEIRRLLDDGEGAARIGFVENSAVFEKGNTTLTMQLLEGQFPDYQQVIPAPSSVRIIVEKEKLSDALRRTSLLAPDKAQGVRLEVAKNTLALFANNPDLGEAREELDVEYTGEDAMKIGFNFRYLMDVIAVLTEEKVEIEVTEPLLPGIVRAVGSENYRAIIMPMRL